MFKKIIMIALMLVVSSGAMAMNGYWVEASGGYIPPYAQQMSQQQNGVPLFLCRSQYQGVVYTGNLNPAFRGCSIAANGAAVTLGNYQVLVTAYAPGAVVANEVVMAGPAVMMVPSPVMVVPAPVYVRPPVVLNVGFIPPFSYHRNVYYSPGYGGGGGYHHGNSNHHGGGHGHHR